MSCHVEAYYCQKNNNLACKLKLGLFTIHFCVVLLFCSLGLYSEWEARWKLIMFFKYFSISLSVFPIFQM